MVISLKNNKLRFIILANNVPYGYKKDENDKTKWLVDETSSEIVKEIFNLFIQGHGTFEIARILRERKVLTPSEYNTSILLQTQLIKIININVVEQLLQVF